MIVIDLIVTSTEWFVTAGGLAVSKASSTLLGLANEIQRVLEEFGSKGRQLEGGINLIGRKHLEFDVEAARELLSDASNQWFAFFRVRS